MGNNLDNAGDGGHRSSRIPEARQALSNEFAGELPRQVYPGPPSANELLQSGAQRLKINQQDTIGSAMSAFKDANKWDPAIVIHLTKGGMTHLNSLADAGILNHQHTNDLKSVAAGSLVFGTAPDGKVQAAVKGQNGLYRIGEDNKWTADNGQNLFKPGTKFDIYTQVKPMTALTDNQRQEVAAIAGRPISFGAMDLKTQAKAMPYQLEDGVSAGRFSRQTGLDWQTLNHNGKAGDIFVSQDGAIRGRVVDGDKVQIWNHERKIYAAAKESDLAQYNTQQYRLYHPTPKV